MTDEPVETPPVVVKRGIGWGRRIAQLLLAIVVLVVGFLVVIDTGPGHRLIANRIATLKPARITPVPVFFGMWIGRKPAIGRSYPRAFMSA